jgi:hypothetical protein
MLRRRPFFPRVSAALSAGMRRGCAQHKSDDTAVVPPIYRWTRRGNGHRKPWRALLRQRRGFPCTGAELVNRNGAGLRPAKVGRHGGRPSNEKSASGSASNSCLLLPSSFRLPLDLRKASFPNCGPDGSRSRYSRRPGCRCRRGRRQCSSPRCRPSCRRG